MLYIIIGFAFGFTIPYLARRFAKFMPATLAYALYRIFHINKTVSYSKRKNNHKYQQLCHRYFMRSLGWGIITSAVIFLASQVLPSQETPWVTFLIIVLFVRKKSKTIAIFLFLRVIFYAENVLKILLVKESE